MKFRFSNLHLVRWAFLAGAVCASAAADANAVLLTINNPSFETVTGATLTDGQSSDNRNPPIAGWTVVETPSNMQVGSYNPNNTLIPGTNGPTGYVPGGDGLNVGFINASGPTFTARVSQTLGDALEANTKYTLTVAFGMFQASFRPNAGFKLELLAGSTVLASATNSIVLPQQSLTDVSISYTSSNLDPLLGQFLTIRISNTTGSNTGANGQASTLFDNVRLDALDLTVPEPSTVCLLLGGVIGLFGRRKIQLRKP